MDELLIKNLKETIEAQKITIGLQQEVIKNSNAVINLLVKAIEQAVMVLGETNVKPDSNLIPLYQILQDVVGSVKKQ